jgi:8-oxo-dGTP pyrophosphatase MutT (NUDIX family)
MQLNFDTVDTPALPAATVMMLRDTPAGMEVFLVKRHSASDVLGGAYVFPGGKVDVGDTAPDMARRLDQSPTALHAALNEHDIDAITAAGLYVAALREVYEECGVLFAEPAPNETEDSEPQSQASEASLTHLTGTGASFDTLMDQHGLRLQTRKLVPWARWVTPTAPSLMRKRFDTRFFVSLVPSLQTASHDDHETTDSVWLSPRDALNHYWQDRMALAPPQIMSLAHLARFTTAGEAMADALGRKPALIRPQPYDMEGTRVICYPGDALHSVKERAVPGPTRLYYRNKRFEPQQGFDALFD